MLTRHSNICYSIFRERVGRNSDVSAKQKPCGSLVIGKGDIVEKTKLHLHLDTAAKDVLEKDKKWTPAWGAAIAFLNKLSVGISYPGPDKQMCEAYAKAHHVEANFSIRKDCFDIPEVLLLEVKFYRFGKKEPDNFCEAMFSKCGDLLHAARS